MAIGFVPGGRALVEKITCNLSAHQVLCLQANETRHGLASRDKNQTESSKRGDDGQQSKDVPVKSKEDMQQRLGLGLKSMYLSVLDEPLPDDMLALLDQLEDDDDSDSSRSHLDE